MNGWDYNPLSLREGLASETRLELPGLVPERRLGTYCACVYKRIAVWKEGRMEKVKNEVEVWGGSSQLPYLP